LFGTDFLPKEPVEGHPYISTEHIIQRPKVVYSEEAGQYHVRARTHIEDPY
jgi:hypothetical protein